MKYTPLKSIAAGLYISIGCAASIATGSKIIGAIAFSVGLIAVILLGADLYTGKICYARRGDALPLLATLLTNLLTAYVCGALYQIANNPLSTFTIKSAKPIPLTLLGGVVCGILIFAAVEGYRSSKSILSIVFPVATFILVGGEHCIADAFYFGASGCAGVFGWAWLSAVIVGNTIGGLLAGYRWREDLLGKLATKE